MAVTKVINSESKQYKPVLVDSLVLDAAPTVGSLNGVTSDGVAKAISGSGSVPTPTADDDGKVLTANDGSYAWDEPTGTEYSAGTGITISEENAIAVTEAISSGAAAGATAVQPAALNDYALSRSLATVATSGSYADLSNKPTIPTVDQNYNASSTNAQSGVAVAQAIAGISVDEVPDVTSTDNGKVLTASYSGGQGSYSWQTAQGGGGGASYTAGQGIAIDGNNAISVDASASDFTFGQSSSLPKWSNKYNFMAAYYPDSSVICTKDSYINLASETGNVHLVCDNTGMVAGNYAVCNANYAFSNWRLTSDVKIEISKTASDWTFTGNTFTLDNGLWYITIAGTTGSTVTPNGETPVEISDVFDTALFNVITNPNQLSLKTSIPTVDQSYNASSTHAQSGTAVAQALASAGGGITWTKITSMTTTSYSLTANFSYSIPRGKTAVQVSLMLRLSEFSGTWSTIPKEMTVKLKLTDDYSSIYYPVGSITNPNNWLGGQPGTVWMLSGTVVVPSDWYLSIDGIQLELPVSGGSLPETYSKDLFVGIA